MVRLTDRPDMTLDVYRGRKTTMQCTPKNVGLISAKVVIVFLLMNYFIFVIISPFGHQDPVV